MFWKSYSVLLLSSIVGCSRSGPSTEPTPEPVPQARPSAPDIRSAARTWTLSTAPSTPPQQYTSISTTNLELQSETLAAKDSFSVTTVFTVQSLRSSQFSRITGSIDRIVLPTSRTADTQGTPLSDLPFAFTGRFQDGGLILDSAQGRSLGAFTSCENAALNRITAVQRILITPPLVLATGASWRDSSTVPACSGSIPVQLTTVQTYQAVGEVTVDGRPAIAIDRTETIGASGEGTQGQHRVSIRAAGTGTSRLNLDPVTGLLKTSEGTSRTELTVVSSGRSQRFIQTVRERTTLN